MKCDSVNGYIKTAWKFIIIIANWFALSGSNAHNPK